MSLSELSQDQLREAEMNFEMPSVEQGDIVMFYPNGHKNDRDEKVGFVQHVRHRSVILFVPVRSRNQYHECVRHVDDPALAIRPEVAREEGAWDYGGSSALRRDLQDAKKRIAALETKLSSKSRSTSKSE